MAEAVVSLVLETLRDLLLEETKFLSGIRRQVKGLETQLKEMKCLLEDTDRRQYESKIIRQWIAEIRNLSYEAEDAIEMYAFESSSKRAYYGFRQAIARYSCGLNKGFALHGIGSQISEITSGIEGVTTMMEGYGLRSIIQGESSVYTDNNQRWIKQTYPFEIDDSFIGMEDDVRQLVSLMVDDKKHRVISIWGMGGTGKTTIARKVYNHEESKKSFGSFAWVCITQQCQIRFVLEEVLMQLIQEKREKVIGLTDAELIQQLHKVQKEKRCMIVLDDLWQIDHWEGLKLAFLAAGANTKVLLTTRKENIADVGFPYKLRLLSKEDGWNLLQKRAFQENNVSDLGGETEYFEEVGKEMVLKCGYPPLVISTLGGVLSKRISLKEWKSVNENIDAYIYRGEGAEEDDKIHEVLDLSYDDLPFYLKPCFLFMGNFEEDKYIDAEYLCMLWITEGMVSCKQKRRGETMMDVAERYLSELASRCLVQVQTEDAITGKRYRLCQLHDVVRELCLSKGAKEDFRLKVMSYEGGKYSIMSPSIANDRTRLLTIHFRGDVGLQSHVALTRFHEETTESIRSLQFLCDASREEIEIPHTMLDFRKFKLLRVLVFRCCKFEGGRLPREIGSLVHLRYLQLLACELDKLPSSIRNLIYLYTLDLRDSWNVQIPNVFKKLVRLKHLFLPYYDEDEVQNYRLTLEGLDELETLHGFNSLVHDLVSVYRMKNLRHLLATLHDIESLSNIINGINTHWNNLRESWLHIKDGCDFTSEEGLAILKSLLACSNIHFLAIYVPIRKLPVDTEAQIVLPNLVVLQLSGCEIEDDPMEMLEKLPCLEALDLVWRSFVGEEMTCHEMGFRGLKLLLLQGLPKLRDWRIERGAMPNLSDLEISSCPDLRTIPSGLKFIPTLQNFKIQKELRKRVMDDGQEGEDFHIVRHVHYIYEA